MQPPAKQKRYTGSTGRSGAVRGPKRKKKEPTGFTVKPPTDKDKSTDLNIKYNDEQRKSQKPKTSIPKVSPKKTPAGLTPVPPKYPGRLTGWPQGFNGKV